MTVEQLAEQYADNINLDTKWNNPRQVVEQAYIAGYAEAYMVRAVAQFAKELKKCDEALQKKGYALVQWHKVADGDLPKECKMVLVYTKEFGIDLDVWTGTEFEQSVTEPIAWCEIPAFTE